MTCAACQIEFGPISTLEPAGFCPECQTQIMSEVREQLAAMSSQEIGADSFAQSYAQFSDAQADFKCRVTTPHAPCGAVKNVSKCPDRPDIRIHFPLGGVSCDPVGVSETGLYAKEASRTTAGHARGFIFQN